MSILKKLCMTEDTSFESEKAYPLTITANYNRYLNDYAIYGSSVQNGTPTPDAPIEVQSVGDLVTSGEYAGKYKIPVSLTQGETVKTTDIYLDAPLRRIGDYTDYIDFKKQAVIRQVGEKVIDGNESWAQQAYHGENTRFFALANAVENRHTEGSYSANLEICNRLKRYSYSLQSISRDYEGFCFNPGTQYIRWLYVRINKSRLADTADTEGLSNSEWLTLYKEWLGANPLTFYYMLEKAERENIALPPLLQFKGECVYETDTAISPSGIQVKYY